MSVQVGICRGGRAMNSSFTIGVICSSGPFHHIDHSPTDLKALYMNGCYRNEKGNKEDVDFSEEGLIHVLRNIRSA